jgi:hypothetical protein
MSPSRWADDGDDADADDTVPCPYCQKPIHEDSQRCPHCEMYISEEDAPPRPRSWWFIVGMILALLVALMWALGGL